jgi:hypothetical protein
MTIDKICILLANNGWKISHAEFEEIFITKNLSDRIIGAYLNIEKLGISTFTDKEDGDEGLEILTLSPYLSTESMCVAETFITSETNEIVEFCIIDRPTWVTSKESVKVEDQDVVALITQIVEWAKSVDLDDVLKRNLEIKPDSTGAAPLLHLAALAESGDVQTLDYYWASMNAGVNLGFVPYITIEYIERAREFAKERAKDKNWLPKKLVLDF